MTFCQVNDDGDRGSWDDDWVGRVNDECCFHSTFTLSPQYGLTAGPDSGDMTINLHQGTHRSHRSEGATPAAGATAQSAAAGSAMPSPTHSSSTTPADEQTGDMISPGHWIMFVAVFIGPLLAIGIYTFFRLQPQITQIIEGLGANGIRLF